MRRDLKVALLLRCFKALLWRVLKMLSTYKFHKNRQNTEGSYFSPFTIHYHSIKKPIHTFTRVR
jgi:hypothetical protein